MLILISSYRATVQRKEQELVQLRNSQPTNNRGKELDKVCKRQQRRKLATLKESAKEALKFAGSYNLDLTSISFEKRQPHCDPVIFNYSPTHPSSSSSLSPLSTPVSLSTSSSFSALTPEIESSQASSQQSSNPPDSSSSVQQILYLLDSYGVSDDFYHELSMIQKSLPQSYTVKNLRTSLSSTVNIQKLPQGWYVPFHNYLQLSLCRLLDCGHHIQSPIEVKISGDGAPFYRSSSFILLSFSFPLLDPKSSSANGMKHNI